MTTPRYYLDTEFIDDGAHETLQLISIALVCSDGRELYLVNSEFDRSRCDTWLQENVIKQLPVCACPGAGTLDHLGHNTPECKWRTRSQIRDAVAEFVRDPGDGVKPEVWAYFASYDWVLFCQLFGRMIDMPKHFPWLVNDLKTWATYMGYTGKFKELLPDTGHHDALCDARWNRAVHEILLGRFEYLKQQSEGLKLTFEENRIACAIADKLLDDLNDRSGFSVDSDIRQMIRPDWIKLITTSLS